MTETFSFQSREFRSIHPSHDGDMDTAQRVDIMQKNDRIRTCYFVL